VQPRNIEKLITKVQDSTVTIFCRPNDPKNKGGFGSGWAIDLENQQGKRFPTTLITNYHVIDECLDGKGKVTVLALFGKEYQAVIDNWDEENDLASIASALEVTPLKLSEYEPFPGYWVAAIGSADGYEGSVAFGNVLNGTKYEVLITVPLSHGNSGGPLVDSQGRAVGVNSAIATLGSAFGASGSIGLGFSIPFNQAKRIADELIATGKSTKPFLGVSFDPTFTGPGLRINNITPDSAAEKAGLTVGTIVKSINGFKVNDAVTAIVRIRSNAPGDRITVVTESGGTNKTFNITLGSAPALP
jgi:putative serine protease PepD